MLNCGSFYTLQTFWNEPSSKSWKLKLATLKGYHMRFRESSWRFRESSCGAEIEDYGSLMTHSRTSISGAALSGKNPRRGKFPVRSEFVHRQNVNRFSGFILSAGALRVYFTSRLSSCACSFTKKKLKKQQSVSYESSCGLYEQHCV
jgi:hypothetical protein